MLIILFGLSGSGKTYIGKLISTIYKHFYFFDGDDILTDEMKSSIKNGDIFTDKMRDDYVQLLISKTKELLAQHKDLIIAQGLYKQKNRLQLLENFPDSLFIQINRKNKSSITVNDLYADKITTLFESMPSAIQINNNSNDDNELMEQISSKIPSIVI